MAVKKLQEDASIGDIIEDGLSMLKGVTDMGGAYEDRLVGRVEKSDNNGVGVSSCWTSDSGYETALIPTEHKIVIVERYDDKEACAIGHAKWVKFAADENNATAVDVGYGSSIAESTMPIRGEGE